MKTKRIANLACAGLLAAVSASVLAGWMLDIRFLIAWSPSFTATQFNTALCFALLAVGMAAVGWRGGWLTGTCAAVVFAIGSLTLAEYFSGISFGIDAWSGYYTQSGGSAHPGRIAQDGAIALTSLAAALWLRTDGNVLIGWKAIAVSTLGSIPAAIGLGAVLGFAAGFESVNGWVGFTLVGPPTAILSLLGGANIIWQSYDSRSAAWLPIPLGMGLLSLLLVLTQAVRSDEEARLKALSQTTAQHLADNTRARLSELLTALDRMAGRWNAAGGTPSILWESDATAYLRGYPALQALSLLNKEGHVYENRPLPSVPEQIEKLLREDPLRVQALWAARRTGKAQLTPPLHLARGGSGILYVFPLTAHGLDDGLQLAVIKINDVFGMAVDKTMLDQFEISAREGDYRIFSTAQAPAQAQRTTGEAHAGIMGSSWVISVTPNARLAAGRQTVPNLFLGVGLLVIALVTLSSFLATRWRANMVVLQMHEAELRRSEETFRATMESAPMGMALLTPEGKRLGCNRALCRMTGYTGEELLVLHPRQLFPEYFDADRAQIARLVKGQIEHYEMEQIYLTYSGKALWVQVNASLAKNADGSPKHIIKQILDIHERKEIERMKSEFVSVVSHELRTPLTAISGAMGLLAVAGDALPEKFRNLVQIAHRNCERLIMLVNDILDMEKLAADRMVFDMEQQNLTTLVRQSLEANALYARKFGVSFHLDAPEQNIPVLVDGGRLGQVLANLLSNAAKFSHEDGRVDITIREIDGRGHVAVRDYGVGMSEEFKARIFGRFAQADSSVTRAKGGTGLGLHISKELTERMGGSIGFSSSAGQGTTFWLEFPLAETQFHLEPQKLVAV